MTLGTDALLATGFLGPPTGDSAATPAPFALLQLDPDAEMVILMEARPFARDDESLLRWPFPLGLAAFLEPAEISVRGAERAVRAADAEFTTGDADVPPHGFWDPRLGAGAAGVFRFEQRGFDRAEPSGEAGINVGEIDLANLDGGLDEWADLEFAGREVRLLAGGAGFPRTAFVTVFRGTASGIALTEDLATIALRDHRTLLDVPLQRRTWGGTGGADGDPELEGVSPPLAWGRIRNLRPPVLDQALLIHALHDGPIAAVHAVRDRGVPLDPAGDWPDHAALAAATIASGEYGTSLAAGLIRLGGDPAGEVTVDFDGDAAGGWASSTAAILRRLLARSSLADPADIYLASLAALDARFPGVVHLVAGADETVGSAVARLLAAAGAWLSFGRDGRAQVHQLRLPAPTGIPIGDDEILSIGRSTTGQRSRERRVGFRRVHHVQRDDALAGSVASSDRAFWGQPWRYRVATNPVAAAESRLARSVTLDSHLDEPADAEAFAAFLAALHGPPRHVYELEIAGARFRHWIGDTVTVTTPRFGLAGGRRLRIIGIAEDYGGGATTLWGWG